MKLMVLILILVFPALGVDPAPALVVEPAPVEVYPDVEIEYDLIKNLKKSVPDGVELQLDKVYLPSHLPRTAELIWFRPRPPYGLIQFEYRWKKDRRSKSVFGTAEVSAEAKVAVASTPIRHGEVFNSLNVSFEQRKLEPRMNTGFFQNMHKLSLLRAKGYIRTGVVLGLNNTEPARLVRQGQMVELSQEKHGIRVMAEMKALQDGKEFEWIRVQNVNTGKVVQAEVYLSGKVRIP